MTTLLYFLICFLAITVFVGGLFAAFKVGEQSGISKYGYKEDNDEISDDDE